MTLFRRQLLIHHLHFTLGVFEGTILSRFTLASEARLAFTLVLCNKVGLTLA